MKSTATFRGDMEVEAEFEADATRCDYPDWWEFDNAKLISFKICGVEVLHHLPTEAVKMITEETGHDLEFGEPE